MDFIRSILGIDGRTLSHEEAHIAHRNEQDRIQEEARMVRTVYLGV